MNYYEYLVNDNGVMRLHISDYILTIGDDIGGDIIVLKLLRTITIL